MLLFGTDPEVFAVVQDEPKVVPEGCLKDVPFALPPAEVADRYGMREIGGTEKHPVYFQNADFTIIGDGVAYEINLRKPYDSPEELLATVKSSVSWLEDNLGKFGLSVYKKPVVNFNCVEFWTPQKMKDSRHFWSTVFGCDADYDASEVEQVGSKISDVATHPLRYGGGHIHISCQDDEYPLQEFLLPFVRILAIYVGNYCLARSNTASLEKERAKYYGKACKYRPQEYPNGTKGVEYRTPSNGWLSMLDEDALYIFELIKLSASLLHDRVVGRKVLAEYLNPTIDAIASGNQKTSQKILESLGVL